MTASSKGELRHAPITLILILFGILPVLAQNPELVVQTGHRAMIRTLAISPDNKLIASAGADQTIIIWDIDSGKQISTLTGHAAWIFSLTFSADKKYLASGSYDGVVRIWNLTNRKVEFEIDELQPLNITSLAFSPDGNTLVIANASSEIKVWDTRAGKMRPPLQGHSSAVTQVAFLSDRKTLVSSSLDKTMRFWNYAGMKSKTAVTLPVGVTGFAFSPNEKFVAVTTTTMEEKLRVFEFKDNKLKKALITIPPRIISNTLEGTIQYRNWRVGFSLTGLYAAGALYFLSENELAFVDGLHLKVRDIASNKETLVHEIESSYGAYAVTGYRDGKLLIYGDGADIKMMDFATRERRELKGDLSVFHTVDFSRDGRTLKGLFGTNGFGSWGKKRHSSTVEEAMEQMHRINNQFATYLYSEGLGIEIRPYDPAQPDIYLLEDDTVTEVLKGHRAPVTAIAVNADETMLASNSEDGTFLLWDLKARKIIRPLKASGNLIRFSPNGEFLAVSDEDKTVKLFDVKKLEKEPISIDAKIHKVMLFSPDSEVMAAVIIDRYPLETDPSSLWFIERVMRARHVLKLWRVGDGEPVNSFGLFNPWGGFGMFDAEGIMGHKTNTEPFGSAVFNEASRYKFIAGPVAFWKDHTLMAASLIDHVTENYQIKIWNPVTYDEVHSLAGHTASIRSLAFSPNGKFLASASFDGTLKLWSLKTDTELATLITLDEDNWVVYTPQGRFDTNIDLSELNKLSWTWPADPFNPLSLRVFMRDYYEQNLLLKLLAEENLPSVRDLSRLNRAQPLVSIKEIKPDGVDTVEVIVEVASTASRHQTDVGGGIIQSGVFDVRLLRDGQLVATSVTSEALTDYIAKAAKSGKIPASGDRELELWRRTHEVKLNADGRASLTFRNIKFPQRGEIKEVGFSAYAFNSDRVTSEITPPYIYKVLSSSAEIKRRAYVVTVGVDVTSDPNWRLAFAPNGAREVEHLLKENLKSKYEVVVVPLISEYKGDSLDVTGIAAKGDIQTALRVLSGLEVAASQRQLLPNQEELRTVTPDDLVVVYIASHGYADPGGTFYMIPSDIGEPAGVSEELLDRCLENDERSKSCDAAREFLQHSISSGELTQLLQDIDAGEMVLILDSCHSAAVSGPNFKPGPMGDRSFGQLAYDKGMLVLAATQAENVAWGGLELGDRSLLTYALTKQKQAVGQPFDLRQWLGEAERQVPKLYERFVKSEQPSSSGGGQQQEPLLFDFTSRQTARTNNN